MGLGKWQAVLLQSGRDIIEELLSLIVQPLMRAFELDSIEKISLAVVQLRSPHTPTISRPGDVHVTRDRPGDDSHHRCVAGYGERSQTHAREIAIAVEIDGEMERALEIAIASDPELGSMIIADAKQSRPWWRGIRHPGVSNLDRNRGQSACSSRIDEKRLFTLGDSLGVLGEKVRSTANDIVLLTGLIVLDQHVLTGRAGEKRQVWIRPRLGPIFHFRVVP